MNKWKLRKSLMFGMGVGKGVGLGIEDAHTAGHQATARPQSRAKMAESASSPSRSIWLAGPWPLKSESWIYLLWLFMLPIPGMGAQARWAQEGVIRWRCRAEARAVTWRGWGENPQKLPHQWATRSAKKEPMEAWSDGEGSWGTEGRMVSGRKQRDLWQTARKSEGWAVDKSTDLIWGGFQNKNLLKAIHSHLVWKERKKQKRWKLKLPTNLSYRVVNSVPGF